MAAARLHLIGDVARSRERHWGNAALFALSALHDTSHLAAAAEALGPIAP
ncbi:hypothetical protein AB0958_10845 [Streptomyces sp. NPDC006655]